MKYDFMTLKIWINFFEDVKTWLGGTHEFQEIDTTKSRFHSMAYYCRIIKVRGANFRGLLKLYRFVRM